MPARVPASKPSKPSAADILRLNRPSAQQTLPVEMEVDQYLSDPDTGSGTLEFWQVIFLLFKGH